jgi:multidrug transporter EmrE-like cation transporter
VQGYIHWAAAGAVGLFFIVNGAMELPKWRGMVADFVRWGYPRYWPVVTCLLKIVSGILVFVPGLQLAGFAGAALVVVAGVGTLFLHREKDAPKAAVPGLVILGVIAVAVYTRVGA